MHTLTLVVVIDETITLFAWGVTKNATDAAKEKNYDHGPHTASNARTLSFYFSWTLVPTFRTRMFKRLFVSACSLGNFVDCRIIRQK